jgi:hypothetical protein
MGPVHRVYGVRRVMLPLKRMRYSDIPLTSRSSVLSKCVPARSDLTLGMGSYLRGDWDCFGGVDCDLLCVCVFEIAASQEYEEGFDSAAALQFSHAFSSSVALFRQQTSQSVGGVIQRLKPTTSNHSRVQCTGIQFNSKGDNLIDCSRVLYKSFSKLGRGNLFLHLSPHIMSPIIGVKKNKLMKANVTQHQSKPILFPNGIA